MAAHCMFVMWQEVVTSGRGGCCQMMAPGGTMCEMKVGCERGRGGGGRNERKTRRRGREEPRTTNSPFPFASQPAVLQLLAHIDPGGAVNGGAAWKVSAGEAQPTPPKPPTPTFVVPQALRGLAITLEPLKQTLPLSRLSTPHLLHHPPPQLPPPATHMYAV